MKVDDDSISDIIILLIGTTSHRNKNGMKSFSLSELKRELKHHGKQL